MTTFKITPKTIEEMFDRLSDDQLKQLFTQVNTTSRSAKFAIRQHEQIRTLSTLFMLPKPMFSLFRQTDSVDDWQILDIGGNMMVNRDRMIGYLDGLLAEMNRSKLDADRLDHLEKRRAKSRSNGFQWDTFTYQACSTEQSIREQIDALITK